MEQDHPIYLYVYVKSHGVKLSHISPVRVRFITIVDITLCVANQK